LWKKWIDEGSPPCSPQMPSLMSGRAFRPFSTAMATRPPVPTVSIEANGSRSRIFFSW
jgi:hypothetical protein